MIGTLIAGILGWFFIGYVNAGAIYKSFQKEYPNIAKEARKSDHRFAILIFFSGPFSTLGVWETDSYARGVAWDWILGREVK
jgi:hypothetical protein